MIGRPTPSTWPVPSVTQIPRCRLASTPTQLTVTHGVPTRRWSGCPGCPAAKRVMIVPKSARLNGSGLQASTA